MEINLPEFIASPAFWVSIIFFYSLKQTVKFVPQNRGYVVYTFGKYTKTLASGPNVIFPFAQRIAADQNMKEQILSVWKQSAITKDNITLEIDGVLYIKVVDAGAATNNVEDYKSAVIQLAMTSMRNAIGSMELDECFRNRDAINSNILTSMSEATSSWGVTVVRYEIKEITPPKSIKEDMEKQMSAEREKRSQILTAEGVKQSLILTAQGEREAAVLAAEADKKEQVLKAEGGKQKQILESEGKAQAIERVASAEAKALDLVGKAAASGGGEEAVNFRLAMEAIAAHKAAANEKHSYS